MSAHLCLQIGIRDGSPVVIGADIYSSGPMHLTSVNGIFHAELFEFSGDYGESRQQVLDHLKAYPKRYSWLYQYFAELR